MNKLAFWCPPISFVSLSDTGLPWEWDLPWVLVQALCKLEKLVAEASAQLLAVMLTPQYTLCITPYFALDGEVMC